jgi:hypothetical protein
MKRKKTNPTSETSIEALQKAILDLHGCKATWIKSILVKEVFEGETVWEGMVQVFEVDHPKSKLCYAWSYGLDKSKKRRFFAVLHQGIIDSPKNAVKAAITKEFRERNN